VIEESAATSYALPKEDFWEDRRANTTL